MPARLNAKGPGEFIRDHLQEPSTGGRDYVGSMYQAYKDHLRSAGVRRLPCRLTFHKYVWLLKESGAIVFDGAQATSFSAEPPEQLPAVNVDGGSSNLIVTVSGYTIRLRIGSVTGSTQGIVAGTSNAALDRDQFNLVAKINHGSGAGQLFYNTQLYDPLTAITGGYRLRLFRQLDNNSGAGITIQEVGLIVDHNTPGVLNNFSQFLVLRDLVPGGHAVPDGGSVILRYDLEWLV